MTAVPYPATLTVAVTFTALLTFTQSTIMSEPNISSQLQEIEPPKADLQEFNFRFRKDKDTGTQRPSIKVNLPVPNVNGLVEILTNGVLEDGKYSKELELLFEAITDTIRFAATELINADENITSDRFPYEKLTWTVIANSDRSDGRSDKIPEDVWKAFVEDYVSIMPALTNKTKEQISNAAAVFVNKLNMIRSNKVLLSQLKDQFTIYVSATKNGEQFSEIVELLNRKFKTYLEADKNEAILNNL